jgi:hypothetical protein
VHECPTTPGNVNEINGLRRLPAYGFVVQPFGPANAGSTPAAHRASGFQAFLALSQRRRVVISYRFKSLFDGISSRIFLGYWMGFAAKQVVFY